MGPVQPCWAKVAVSPPPAPRTKVTGEEPALDQHILFLNVFWTHRLLRSVRLQRCFPSQHLGAVNHLPVNTSGQDMGSGGGVAPSSPSCCFHQNTPSLWEQSPCAEVAEIRSESPHSPSSPRRLTRCWTREGCQFIRSLWG